MRAISMTMLVALLLCPGPGLWAGEEPDPAEVDEEPAEPVEQPGAPDAVQAGPAAVTSPEQAPAADAKPAAPARKLISVLVLDTLDRGAGAERTARIQAALKRALNGLEQIEVLGPRGLMSLQGKVPTEVQVQLGRADGFVRKGREDLFNLAVEEAVESFQSARVTFRRHLKWLDDPERMIIALMGLAEALAASGDRDSAEMAYREVLVLSPEYVPDPGQVPTKLRSLFDQVRQAVASEPAGQLSVDVAPSGSAVVLDGLTVGKTPLSKGGLPAGLHMVRVEREGFSSLRRTVVVVADETARIEGELAPQRIGRLIDELRASLGRDDSRDEAIGLARKLARASGLPIVLASQLIDVGDNKPPVLSVAVVPADAKPSVVAARLPADESDQLDQVVGALAWQISDTLDEGSAPVPPPASLGLSFARHLLGRPPHKLVSLVRLAPGTDTTPDDAAYPGSGPRAGDPALPGGPPVAPPPDGPVWWKQWWFWTGVGAVVAGSVATSLALTLEPKKKTIYEADQIRIRINRDPSR